MDESPATRRSLIVKLRDPADTAAWREFVAIYEPLVYRLARRKGLQDADAHDLCQEVFRAVAGAVDRWDPARGSFRGWLSRIARNLLINFLTRRRSQPRGQRGHQRPGTPRGPAGRRPVGHGPLRGRVPRGGCSAGRPRRSAAEFAPATWQAFWQTAVEGRPPAEVAAELGLSVGAVYVARSRVLARLKRRIEQLGDEARRSSSEVDHEDPNRTPVIRTGCGCWPRIACRRPRWPGSSEHLERCPRVPGRARPAGRRRPLARRGPPLPRGRADRAVRARPGGRANRSTSSRRPTGPTRSAGSAPTRSRACSAAAAWAWCSRRSTPP